MTQEWICHSEDETAQAAQNIAKKLEAPCILCLTGDLGAGKTAFCRSLIRFLMNDPNLSVPSPTYTFLQTYNDDKIWHFDLYRLENPQQIYDLGWEEALYAEFCLIEWPERLSTLKPKNTVDITIDLLQDGARRIILHL